MENCNWVANPNECFLEFLKERNYSEKSIKSYKSIFGSLVHFITKHSYSLKTMNERILQEWMISCAISGKTEIRYLSLISSVLDILIEKSIIDENCARQLIDKKEKLKKGRSAKRLPVALSESEFNALIGVIGQPGVLPRVRMTVMMLAGCGLRVSELCDLQAKDVHVDVENPYLRVIGKGDKEREVPIPEEVCHEIEVYQASTPSASGYFLGVERKGVTEKYSPSGVFRMVQSAMRAAKIVKTRMSPHVLRHTYATRQLHAGIPIAILKMWMGHDSIVTTAIYEHSVVARSSVRPKF